MVDDRVDGEGRQRPVRRVILLGASNVTLGLGTVIATAQRAWGAPLDIMAAIGHGRSFGLPSTVLGRTLPGIVECGLWDELLQRPPLPTAALVTDIGNDIIYGRRTDTILRWVETCLARLRAVTERLVVTRLPLASLSRTPNWRMRLLVSLFFPSSRFDLAEALDRARELDGELLSYAGRYGAYIVRPQRAWYTWDPIHVARTCRAAAWRAYLGCWTDGKNLPPVQETFFDWMTAVRARPLYWKRFGHERHCRQPSVQLADGTTLSLY